jgi:hypothetical protein
MISTGARRDKPGGCQLTGAITSPLALMTSIAGLWDIYRNENVDEEGVNTVKT